MWDGPITVVQVQAVWAPHTFRSLWRAQRSTATHTSHTSYPGMRQHGEAGRDTHYLLHKSHRCHLSRPIPSQTMSPIWIQPIDIDSLTGGAGHLWVIQKTVKTAVWRVWAELSGLKWFYWAQRSVIATDRKYQEAFNYQQCYHIIATNNRRSGASVQRREQILLTLATGVRKTASIIELF